MKKLFLATGLAATIAAAWAFYPSHAQASRPAATGYALLTGRFTTGGFSAKGLLTVTMPDGQLQTQEVEVKTGSPSNISSSLEQLHLSEVKKLNELRAAGWRVKTTSQMSATIAGAFYETTYLLEKE